MNGSTLTPGARRLLELLEHLADAAAERHGERPVVRVDPDPEGIPDMAGRVIPREVRDLYSVAGGGYAFGIEIIPPDLLLQENEDIDEMVAEYPLLGIGDLPWGPPPVGDSIVALAAGDPVYVAELDGRPAGVTHLSIKHDSGYRWMAPSLARLFETWIAIVEAGLAKNIAPNGEPHISLRDFEDRTIGLAQDVCRRHSCTLAAIAYLASPA